MSVEYTAAKIELVQKLTESVEYLGQAKMQLVV